MVHFFNACIFLFILCVSDPTAATGGIGLWALGTGHWALGINQERERDVIRVLLLQPTAALALPDVPEAQQESQLDPVPQLSAVHALPRKPSKVSHTSDRGWTQLLFILLDEWG